MSENSKIYNSFRLAEAYAINRPPVHEKVIEIFRSSINENILDRPALDIGCGAGLSTKALEAISNFTVGLEPLKKMLSFSKSVSETSNFICSVSEKLPFKNHSFGIITAAGSLNYANLNLFFPEAKRVLSPGGIIIIYDFSAGSRVKNDERLAGWFKSFIIKYPYPPDYELDVINLNFRKYGFSLKKYQTFEIEIPMRFSEYMSYIFSETNIELAINNGADEKEIYEWCEKPLNQIFSGKPPGILFEGYFAVIK